MKSILSFTIMIFIFLSCGTDNAKYDLKAVNDDLIGVWKTSDDAEYPEFSYDGKLFTFELIFRDYLPNEEEAYPAYKLKTVSLYSVGKPLQGFNGFFEAESQMKEVTLTIIDQKFIDYANATNECGIDSWQLNVPTSVTLTQQCNFIITNPPGTRFFSSFKLEEGRLWASAASYKDIGLTPENRLIADLTISPWIRK